MAKPIVVSIDGVESSFSHAKIERSKLYGARRRVPLDQGGHPCVKSALTADGLYLLQSGMTAQGYFDENGRWLQRSELAGMGPDGELLDLIPSTLGQAQALEPVAPDLVLGYATDVVYRLDPLDLDAALRSRLEAGQIFRFAYNYGADYQLKTAFLLKNAEGFFCLIGGLLPLVWSEPGQTALLNEEELAEDELDFEMF